MDLLKICFKACTASDEPEQAQPTPQAAPQHQEQHKPSNYAAAAAAAPAARPAAAAVPAAAAKPTPQELHNISLACERLWELDEGRLVPRQDYEISLQAAKRYGDGRDHADGALFKRVDESVWRRPTFAAFRALLDNYVWAAGVEETETEEERREIRHFLDLVCATPCMRYALAWLNGSGAWRGDVQALKAALYKCWFGGYRRSVWNDSSGFEHVFVGESKDGKITGFHSWIAFAIYERSELVDYKGLVGLTRRVDDSSDDDQRVISCNFASSDNECKEVSTMFVGTSPEFEFSLYSMCFLATPGREGEVPCTLGGAQLKINVFKIAGDKVGSVFPEAPRER